MKIKFYRFDEDVIIPERMHYSDTGADIYMKESGCILPFETKVIPLGFGIEVPNGYSARLQIRTSVATTGVFCQGCAIDAGYKGEISLILHNCSINKFEWQEDDRLAYIEFYPVVYPQFYEEELNEREYSSFGGTGK